MTHLPEHPRFDTHRARRLDRVAKALSGDPPPGMADIIRDELGVDLSTRHAGRPVAHPFGKASGQLSCRPAQIRDDITAGIGFIVLKTVIAEDAAGTRAMEAWTVRQTRMRVERRSSTDGRVGWTTSWKGRGWHGSLADYRALFDVALRAASTTSIPVVPSVKYHLPGPGEDFSLAEYRHTTETLLSTWHASGPGGEMPLEKDFSPTLAGDVLARGRDDILRWIREVPAAIGGVGRTPICLGLKLMNALGDDDLQVDMLKTVAEGPVPPQFVVVFNRLFDPKAGLAYGGWDLSDRNLRVLDLARRRALALPPMSATGNVCSGRMMVEYARRGCENAQLHTYFQLPLSEYVATGGRRTARGLFTLFFHRTEGLVPWLWHMQTSGVLEPAGGLIRFRDLVTAPNG